jgi:hypothetical protein
MVQIDVRNFFCFHSNTPVVTRMVIKKMLLLLMHKVNVVTFFGWLNASFKTVVNLIHCTNDDL